MTDAILAVRLKALGDIVLTTPALRALHRGYPDRPIDIVTDVRYVALLEGLPGVDRVIGLERNPSSTLATLRTLRRRRYAVAVDFVSTPRTALLVGLSGAPLRVGYDVRGRRIAYSLRIPRDPGMVEGRREYAAASHVRLACAAGGVADGLTPRVTVSDAARSVADRVLREAGIDQPERTVGLVAAGTWATKTWPVSHAAAMAERLRTAGLPILLLSGPGEETVTTALQALVPGLAVLPPCDIGALAAVIERLRGVAGTDSGPRHLAVALGKPTFGWFGPTHPHNWSPPSERHAVWWTDVPCRGCNLTRCPHWTCMPRLLPERAADLILAHFERHAPDAAAVGPAARA